jgi:hypothetical protein
VLSQSAFGIFGSFCAAHYNIIILKISFDISNINKLYLTSALSVSSELMLEATLPNAQKLAMAD